MKFLKNNKALSPVIAAFILIAITVGASILAACLMSMFALFMPPLLNDATEVNGAILSPRFTYVFNKTLSITLNSGQSYSFNLWNCCTNEKAIDDASVYWSEITIHNLTEKYPQNLTWNEITYVRTSQIDSIFIINWFDITIETNPATTIVFYNYYTPTIVLGKTKLTFNDIISPSLSNLGERDTTVTIRIFGQIQRFKLIEYTAVEMNT
jgi:flagellin-like protein